MSWHRQFAALVIVLLSGVSGGCTGGDDDVAPHAAMSVSPAEARYDEPVTISVRGLPAGARTTVTAKATDTQGTTWSASAEYEATSAGVASLDQPPLSGSYTGSNPMGLFESMTPSTPDTFFDLPRRYDVSLQATVDGHEVATGTARRRGAGPTEVRTTQLRPAKDGVYGDLYLPTDTSRKRPALLVFGGSDGGLTRSTDASLLAARGYPSLALAYFKEPGLPQTLADIPLEYFIKALAVLRSQPGVDPAHVFVMGVSRGGEAALLLGSSFPDQVNGVIAGVPSNSVKPGYPDLSRPAWTVHGQPLAGGDVIPVERIRGPVLLSCGGQDITWASCLFTQAVTDRLRERGFRYPVTSLRYPDAGHGAGQLVTYYTSFTDELLATTSGGTVAATQAALAEGYRKLLDLLASQ